MLNQKGFAHDTKAQGHVLLFPYLPNNMILRYTGTCTSHWDKEFLPFLFQK